MEPFGYRGESNSCELISEGGCEWCDIGCGLASTKKLTYSLLAIVCRGGSAMSLQIKAESQSINSMAW